jgi:phage terminase large subunit-like protein
MIASGIGGKVQGYIDGVLSGEIVACKRVKAAVRRHLNDLERQSTPEFPYYFDSRWAGAVCDYFPAMLRHSIGEYEGNPLDLEPWQYFGLWVAFGWKRDADSSRRFRKIYWSMGRKNGKSTLSAGVCHFAACADVNPKTGRPESVGQVLLTATKKEQADVVYSECSRMRKRSAIIQKMSDEKNEQIIYTHNGSYIRKVSSDKPFDGLNPHLVVMDELHAWGEYHRKFYDTMLTGFAARTQPLQFIVTTAGADDSHLWRENYEHACNILDGVFTDETTFAMVYELDEGDDLGDESLWIKANPNIGVSVKVDFLREEWNRCKHTPIGRNRFKRYYCNQMVTSTERAFDPGMFEQCVGDLSDWREADAVGAGVDLGSRDDLSAYALCARFPIGHSDDGKPLYRYEIQSQAYIADDTKRSLAEMPWTTWIYEGEIIKSRYATEDLQADLLAKCVEYGVEMLAYDPHNGQQMGEAMTREGVNAVRMPQNQSNFNEPIRDFLKLVREGRIRFSRSGVLRWAAGNAKICSDRQERWMFDKRDSDEKIDPIVAAVMAFRVASLAPERFRGSWIMQ